LTDAPSHPLAPNRFYRGRTSECVRERGYARIALDRGDNAPRERFAPLVVGLDLVMRAPHGSAKASVRLDDATVEPPGRQQSALALMRRRYNAVRRSISEFDGVEIFPDGSKAKTHRFRKQLLFARNCRTAFGGPLVASHPELRVGWPVEPTSTAAPLEEPVPPIAVALHLHYFEQWDEIGTLLRCAPFTLFHAVTRYKPTLAGRVRSAFPSSMVSAVENRGRDVRPSLQLLEDGAFDPFEIVCKIHGKRSHGGDRLPIFGDVMRRSAYLGLIVGDSWARSPRCAISRRCGAWPHRTAAFLVGFADRRAARGAGQKSRHG
jgi:hypothetical protein